MTTRLEEELADAMRSRAERLRPTGGLVERAVRQHRRRRTRSIATAGAFAVLAIAAAATLSPTYGRTDQTPDGPAMLPVAAITERATAALALDDIEHSVTTDNRYGTYEECWRDRVTGDFRCRYNESKPRVRDTESWSVVRAASPGKVTLLHTFVDHTARTWATRDMEIPAGWPSHEPESPRSLLERGELEMVGEESIDGTATYHLRRQHSDVTGYAGVDHLWVETASFRLVRSVFENDYRRQTDYEWIPRSTESLELLKPAVPNGYSRR
ncbi:hypothetical protein Ais01nite_74180 [Asanoa ishikariensis]|uniref:Uncharacterized protein n=1 Tax=Asanoa ishikariensis TaxID=137265 RepID=A0A1H3UT03_9ACTN|nr:hypothetical protein [Asanoa ishikariensis]GIF69383.1 hypothetical protein Ais01nite_74180 [Asanoa ishikariensis]SDZ65151.1 hypothetical protein SAMN05421684_7943 [Asanoa ishikariensis]